MMLLDNLAATWIRVSFQKLYLLNFINYLQKYNIK